jgi:ATP-dependent exoDNAse (exonuclease V) beta subunit
MTASVRQFPGTPALSPVDRPQRERAVGPSESILVQAPAGSGKTTLLAERFLRLLSTVDEPEQVLAITFTRAAVAEMRQRILAALRNAQQCKPAEHVGEERMQQAATAALEWSERRGWALLDDPAALNIQTIDGLALTIAQQTPLTSRLGPGFQPTEDAGYFYKRAAMRTLQSLEDMHASDPAQRQTAEAAVTLLLHRDNRLQACAELLADMLTKRN